MNVLEITGLLVVTGSVVCGMLILLRNYLDGILHDKIDEHIRRILNK